MGCKKDVRARAHTCVALGPAPRSPLLRKLAKLSFSKVWGFKCTRSTGSQSGSAAPPVPNTTSTEYSRLPGATQLSQVRSISGLLHIGYRKVDSRNPRAIRAGDRAVRGTAADRAGAARRGPRADVSGEPAARAATCGFFGYGFR